MQECFQVTFSGQAPIIKKGHIEPIDISVASRGSNKKVTSTVLMPSIHCNSSQQGFLSSSLFFLARKNMFEIHSLFFSPRLCHFSSRNCQVTMIKNLEVYGLDPAAVATALQRRVQASSILQPIPGSKDKVLVQIQGNQIHQVGTMLLGL